MIRSGCQAEDRRIRQRRDRIDAATDSTGLCETGHDRNRLERLRGGDGNRIRTGQRWRADGRRASVGGVVDRRGQRSGRNQGHRLRRAIGTRNRREDRCGHYRPGHRYRDGLTRASAKCIRRDQRVASGDRGGDGNAPAAGLHRTNRVDVIVGIAAEDVAERHRSTGAYAGRGDAEASDDGHGTGGRAGRIPAGEFRGHLYDFKILRAHTLQIAQIVIVPSRIRGALEEKVAAVVRQDHPVFLHCGQNDLVRRGKSGDVIAGL